VITSTAYLPPVSFFVFAQKHAGICLEAHENFIKQTYRNRARIASANGALDLSIPITRPQGSKTQIQNIEISYSETWHKQHWHAIVSAYNSSPFFAYYEDEFAPFFDGSYTSLWQFNFDIIQTCFRLLGMQLPITSTTEYNKHVDVDCRVLFSPKHPTEGFVAESYLQVFEEKYSFLPDMSILDLLCNLGPEAQLYIKRAAENL